MRGRVGVEHDCGPFEPGRDLRKQLKPLASQRRLEVGEAGDVPARPVEPCGEAGEHTRARGRIGRPDGCSPGNSRVWRPNLLISGTTIGEKRQ
jgi:hypothetical protein